MILKIKRLDIGYPSIPHCILMMYLIILYIITVLEMRAMWLLGAWFAWQLFQGTISLGMADSVGVAFFAHIGGFAAGIVLAVGYKLSNHESLLPIDTRSSQRWDR